MGCFFGNINRDRNPFYYTCIYYRKKIGIGMIIISVVLALITKKYWWDKLKQGASQLEK